MPRSGLNTEQVVDAAAQLIDHEGLGALTLSTLAQRLGVKSPSLYGHVSNLDDLRRRLAMVAAEGLREAITPAAAGLARGDALSAVGHAYRDWAHAHPGLYDALEANVRDLATEPAPMRTLEVILAVLRGYGLNAEDTIHAARTVRAALHGFIRLDVASFQIPVDLEASFDWMLATLDRGLSASAVSASERPAPQTPGPRPR